MGNGGGETTHHEILTQIGGTVATFVEALRKALGDADMMAYLVMMALRLIELRRVLKSSGSLYLHCDPTASHYLKVLLDGVFEPQAFRSEVIWKRTSAHNSARRWGPIHDTILFYSAAANPIWEDIRQPYDQDYVDAFFVHRDKDGRRWRRGDLTGSGIRHGESGSPWRGIDVSAKGRHWAVPIERLEALDAAGRIHWPAKSGGMPQRKRYLDELPGMPLQDMILDIKPVHNVGQERIGYPTQKPIALLDRIIRASSRQGQVVLDAFCGCGTTVEAAEAAGRQWIGIDVSIHAIHVIERRLEKAFGGDRVPKPEGIPADYESAARLAKDNPFQFQWWANYLIGAHTLKEMKRGADRGIDGELFFPNGPGRPYGRLLISVKAGANISPAMIREFRGVLEREKAEMGVFVCLDPPTPAMRREAVVAGLAPVVHGEIPRIQIASIAEWFAGHPPILPPREQLPYAAFSMPTARPRSRPPDPAQPELPLAIRGGRTRDVVTHYNPQLVLREEGAAYDEAA